MHVDQATGDQACEQRSFIRSRADLVRLAQFRVDVALFQRDVEIAAQNQQLSVPLRVGHIRIERFEEPHLRVEVLAAIRHVDRCDQHIAGG